MNPKRVTPTENSYVVELANILIQLCYVESEVRDNALKNLTKYIKEHKNKLKDENIESICKGLFFYYWLSDSMENQKRASIDIAKLIHTFKKTDALTYFGSFLKIMSSRFDTLDRHRLEKFLFLFKVFQAEVLMFLHNSKWNEQYLKRYGEVLIANFDDSKDLYYSYIYTFMREFLENDMYARKKKIRKPFNSKQFIMLMDPFLEMICISSRRLIHEEIRKNIFEKVGSFNLNKTLLKQSIEKYMGKCKNKSSRNTLKQICTILCVDTEEMVVEPKKTPIPIFIAQENKGVEFGKETKELPQSKVHITAKNENQNKKRKTKPSSKHMDNFITDEPLEQEDVNIKVKKKQKKKKANLKVGKDELTEVQEPMEEEVASKKKKRQKRNMEEVENKNTVRATNASSIEEPPLKKRKKEVAKIEKNEEDSSSILDDERETSSKSKKNTKKKEKQKGTKTSKVSPIKEIKSSSIRSEMNQKKGTIALTNTTTTHESELFVDTGNQESSNKTTKAQNKGSNKEMTSKKKTQKKKEKKATKQKKSSSTIVQLPKKNVPVGKSILKTKSVVQKPTVTKKVRFNLENNKVKYIPVDRNKAYPNLAMQMTDWERLLSLATIYKETYE